MVIPSRGRTRLVIQQQPPPGAFVTLGIRIPRTLRRRIRLHCAIVERTVESFVVEALRESLRSRRGR